MSRIIKKYWAWDEKFNNSEFKLRMDISNFLKNKSITRVNSDEEYKVEKDENIKSIVCLKDKIKTIFISKKVSSFIEEGIWDLRRDLFIEKLDNLMKQADEQYDGDLLFVSFMEDFVIYAAIKGK